MGAPLKIKRGTVPRCSPPFRRLWFWGYAR